MKKIISAASAVLSLALMVNGSYSTEENNKSSQVGGQESLGQAFDVLTGAVKVKGFSGNLLIKTSEKTDDSGKVHVKCSVERGKESLLESFTMRVTEDELLIEDSAVDPSRFITLSIVVPKGGEGGKGDTLALTPITLLGIRGLTEMTLTNANLFIDGAYITQHDASLNLTLFGGCAEARHVKAKTIAAAVHGGSLDMQGMLTTLFLAATKGAVVNLRCQELETSLRGMAEEGTTVVVTGPFSHDRFKGKITDGTESKLSPGVPMSVSPSSSPTDSSPMEIDVEQVAAPKPMAVEIAEVEESAPETVPVDPVDYAQKRRELLDEAARHYAAMLATVKAGQVLSEDAVKIVSLMRAFFQRDTMKGGWFDPVQYALDKKDRRLSYEERKNLEDFFAERAKITREIAHEIAFPSSENVEQIAKVLGVDFNSDEFKSLSEGKRMKTLFNVIYTKGLQSAAEEMIAKGEDPQYLYYLMSLEDEEDFKRQYLELRQRLKEDLAIYDKASRPLPEIFSWGKDSRIPLSYERPELLCEFEDVLQIPAPKSFRHWQDREGLPTETVNQLFFLLEKPLRRLALQQTFFLFANDELKTLTGFADDMGKPGFDIQKSICGVQNGLFKGILKGIMGPYGIDPRAVKQAMRKEFEARKQSDSPESLKGKVIDSQEVRDALRGKKDDPHWEADPAKLTDDAINLQMVRNRYMILAELFRSFWPNRDIVRVFIKIPEEILKSDGIERIRSMDWFWRVNAGPTDPETGRPPVVGTDAYFAPGGPLEALKDLRLPIEPFDS